VKKRIYGANHDANNLTKQYQTGIFFLHAKQYFYNQLNFIVNFYFLNPWHLVCSVLVRNK